jgi:polar amino acid transport system substrate-binding protein
MTVVAEKLKELRRRSYVHVAVVTLACLAACATQSGAPDPASVQALAPSGKLRVGLYPGTPTSIVGDLTAGSARGVGFDLGQALAKRAGVPFEPVVLSNNAAVFDAAKAGSVDMVFTNATPARMKALDFSPTVLQVEQGYLVPSGSPISALDQVDRTGVRIGVSEGSTSETTLSRELRSATLVRAPSLEAAIGMLSSGKLDAFATNKAILFEMSDRIPGSRVLSGRYGLEGLAIGIPKGRDAAMPLVSRFVADAKADGQVARAAERAGLRGAVLSQ